MHRFQVGFFPYHAVFSGHCHSLWGNPQRPHQPVAIQPLVDAVVGTTPEAIPLSCRVPTVVTTHTRAGGHCHSRCWTTPAHPNRSSQCIGIWWTLMRSTPEATPAFDLRVCL
jgi:hypothetical protein